ncbi:hypothetical protein [Streptomyces sp. NPDC086787]|uniref:DUF7507 domain-containing protein n=1 Tax=Streptomyces sp. NPDC086787 TaxID=3365759 RepID=UPI00381AB137
MGTVGVGSAHAASFRAAPLECTGDTIYALQNGASASADGTLLALNTHTLETDSPTVTATVVSKIPQGGQTNALGVLPEGAGAYLVNRTGSASSIVVHGYDASSGTWTQYAGTTPGNGVVVVAGAVDPASRIYYYAVLGTGTSTNPGRVTVYGFNTVTNQAIPGIIATFDMPLTSRFSANGDIAFDGAGNLYIVSSANSSNNAAIGVVQGPLPTTGSQTGVQLQMKRLTTIDNPEQRQYNGIAFNNDGALFIQFSDSSSSNTYLQAVNPNTGALIAQPKLLSDTTFTSVDLGACSTNPSLVLQKNIAGRFEETTSSHDQFHLAIAGAGDQPGTNTTTTGNTTGVQSNVAGPVVGVANTTYQLSETAAAGADLDNYTTDYACVDTANGDAPVSSGSASSFELNFPRTQPGSNSPRIVCTFTNTPKAAAPAITLRKSASPSAVTAAGQQVSYSFVVTNTGNVTLTNVGVAETAFSGTGGSPQTSCPGSSLAPGESMTCSAGYTTTQADVNAGQITNTARATGTPPSGPAVSATANETVTAPGQPSLSLAKTVVGDGGDFRVGEQLTYSFLVHNTGNVTLHGVNVGDIAFSGTGLPPEIHCPETELAPNASMTCTGLYIVTQADVDSGLITNTARATGTPPAGTAVHSNDASAEFTPRRSPGITLLKSASPTEVTAAGQQVSYTYLVTNTGNVTLSGLAVADTDFTGSGPRPTVSCPGTTLPVGASVTCTATYTVRQADVDQGSITNEARATATAAGGTPVSATDDAQVTSRREPAVALVKTASPESVTAVGQQVSYSFVVTNTGNVTLTNVGVAETAFSGTGGSPQTSCPGSSLAPGESMTCSAGYTTTQADVNAGQITNTARATGTPPSGPAVSATSSEAVTAQQAPAVTLVKTVVGDGGDFRVGEQLTYSFLVHNTGNVTLSEVNVSDIEFSGTGTAPEITCPETELAPDESMTCMALYVVTQADVDAGVITNTARATGTPPSGTPVTNQSSSVFTPRVNPLLTLLKTALPTEITAAGQTISYSYQVTNTGNVTMSHVAVTEVAFTGSGPVPEVSCPETVLAPGESMTCTAEYTVTQADLGRPEIVDTAQAAGDPPSGATVTSTSTATTTVTHVLVPGIALKKTGTLGKPRGGGGGGGGDKEQIQYTFEVTNTGEVPLTGVQVTETRFTGTGGAPRISCPATTLAVGASMTCTAVYKVTKADTRAGSVKNTAEATGTPPAGPAVTATSNATVKTSKHSGGDNW